MGISKSTEPLKINEYNITTKRYSIPCKIFMPDAQVKKIIIGVHGFAGDKESSVLFALAEQLVKNEGALICFDFPAHGKSEALDNQLRVENCMQDLLDVADYVRDKFPQKEYGIFGTSFGGYITLLCGDKLREFKKVLRAPAVTIAESFVEKIIPVSKDEFLKQGGALCGFERKMYVSVKFYEDLLKYKIQIPQEEILVIHGTEDDIAPFADVKNIADKHPNIKLIPVIGADHRFKKEGELEQILESAMEWYGDNGG